MAAPARSVQLREGSAVGIDPSELMVRHARRRLGRWIARGRVAVEVGASAELSTFADGRFDAIFGAHVVCFWEAQR